LTFKNFYNIEPGYDSGILEMATNDGGFSDLIGGSGSGTVISGGYTGAVLHGTGNPIGGRPGWTGNAGSYLTTTILMPSGYPSGTNFKVRWRMGSDVAVSAPGWSIDSITLSPVQCGVATAKRRPGQLISD
jgi:hypothetical protein